MQNIPFFTSESVYCLRRSDLDFWWPYIHIVLGRHHFAERDKRETASCGYNPTYPVFLIDEKVVKFFGHRPNWLAAFNTECMAHGYLTKDNSILAPRIYPSYLKMRFLAAILRRIKNVPQSKKTQNRITIPRLFLVRNVFTARKLSPKISHLQVRWVY